MIELLATQWWRFWDEATLAVRTSLLAVAVIASSSLMVGAPPALGAADPAQRFDPGVEDWRQVQWADCERPIDLVVEDPSPQRRISVAVAIEEVAAATGLTFVEADVAGSRAISVRFVDQNDPEIASLGALGFAQTQSWNGRLSTVEVVVGVEHLAQPSLDAAAELILRHELAHAVGVDHIDDPDALMFPPLRAELTGFTDVDLRALEDAGRRAGCNV